MRVHCHDGEQKQHGRVASHHRFSRGSRCRTIHLLQFYPDRQRQSALRPRPVACRNAKKCMRYLLTRMSAGCKTTILTTAPQLARVALQCQGPEGTGEVTMSMAHMQTVKVTKKAVPLGGLHRRMRRRTDSTVHCRLKATCTHASFCP